MEDDRTGPQAQHKEFVTGEGNVGGGINVSVSGHSPQAATPRNPELAYQDYVVIVLQSGGNLDRVRNLLEKHQERLGLTLKQAQEIEAACTVRPPPKLTPRQPEYISFFSDVARTLASIVSIRPHEPDGRNFYKIGLGAGGVHFEWLFAGRPRRLGVEIHFEGPDQRRNNEMLKRAASCRKEIERLTGEKVIVQYDWRGWSRLYVEKTVGAIDEELKRWAVDKMTVFYKTLAGKL